MPSQAKPGEYYKQLCTNCVAPTVRSCAAIRFMICGAAWASIVIKNKWSADGAYLLARNMGGGATSRGQNCLE